MLYILSILSAAGLELLWISRDPLLLFLTYIAALYRQYRQYRCTLLHCTDSTGCDRQNRSDKSFVEIFWSLGWWNLPGERSVYGAISYMGVLAIWDPLNPISGFGCLWAPRWSGTECKGGPPLLLGAAFEVSIQSGGDASLPQVVQDPNSLPLAC